MTRVGSREDVDALFARILDRRELRTVFQPVVHLPSQDVVGYEALVRGPEGSALTEAESLVAAANRAGRLVEFDWAARASACRAALEAELDIDFILLMNLEPLALDSECPPDLWPDVQLGFRSYRVVLEVTERSLDRDPGTLLEGVERQRVLTAGIGLDDVGSHPATLSMLPLIAPNLIKLDRSVVQADPDPEVARTLATVHSEAERTGAIILAEGVESGEHRHNALAQGALISQGTYFGPPGPLPKRTEGLRHRAPIRRSAPMFVSSPFDALGGQVDGVGGDDLMLALTRQLGAHVDASRPTLYLSLLPERHLLDEQDLRRMARLAAAGAFAAVLGPDVPEEPGHGVRGTGVRRRRVPRDEWALVAFGPSLSAAVLARRTPDGRDEWMYGVTYDQTRVVAAARSLAQLLGPPEPRYTYES